MDDGLYWVILLMYGSHDLRHIGFRRLTLVNETLGFWGVTIYLDYNPNINIFQMVLFLLVLIDPLVNHFPV